MTDGVKRVSLAEGAQVVDSRGAGVWGPLGKGAQPMAFIPMPTSGPTGNAPASDSVPNPAGAAEQ